MHNNLLQKPFSAYGGARELWCSRDEEILYEGPAGTGKTRTLLEKAYFCAMKYAGMRGLLVRKTRESMTESVLVTFESKVLPPNSPLLEGPQRNLRQSYILPNRSELVLGGIDKSSKIMSTEYDFIACFESTELLEDDLESLTTRLRNGVMPYQQIVADCNPGPPSHWLNNRANKGHMRRILSRHKDNPFLYDHKLKKWTDQGEKYLKKLSRLSGARRLRLFNGLWAASEGMVYENYDAKIHVIKPFRIPLEWRRIRSIDLGFKNPFVCQWWAISPEGEMFCYREIYKSHKIVRDHARRIKILSSGERYEVTVCDHDAEDRATLEEAGIITMPAHKAITPGIEAVQLRLRNDDHTNRPRIFFFDNALDERDEELAEVGFPISTVAEFDGYIYPKGIDGKPIKEEPVKKDDHGMDAMRYAVAYEDNLASMSIQVMTAPVEIVK